ncbi:MAG: M17 family peptidase N-terminal domain-containing protein, partial [Agromyces sp.]
MAVPSLSVTDSPAATSDADVVLLAVRKGADGPELLAEAGFEWVAAALETLGVGGTAEELIRIPGAAGGPRIVAVVGVGARADAASLRLAAGSALRQLKGEFTVAIAVPTADADAAAALLEGAGLGAYGYDGFRSETRPRPTSIVLHSVFDDAAIGIGRVRAV